MLKTKNHSCIWYSRVKIEKLAAIWAKLNASLYNKVKGVEKCYLSGCHNDNISRCIIKRIGIKECLRGWNKIENPELDFDKFWDKECIWNKRKK